MPRIPPFSVISQWPQPDHANPTIRSPWSTYVLGTFTVGLATMLVSLRVYFRKRAGQLALDDLLLVLAMIFAIAFVTVAEWATVHSRWNYHLWDILYEWNSLIKILKVAWVEKILHAFTLTFARWSVLVFYSRLLVNGSGVFPAWRWAHRTTLFLVIAAGIAFVFVSIFQCMPVQAYWTLPLMDAKCLPEGQIVLFFGVLNGVLDLLIGMLPIPIILKLNMPVSEKISVILLLGLGSGAFVCAIIKCYFIYMALLGSWDMSWWTMPIWIAAFCEQNLIIICATLPTLNKPLLARPFKKISRLFGGTDKSASTNYRRSQAFGSQHIHGVTMRKGEVSTIGKGSDEESMPLSGLVVTREVEMAWSPNTEHRP